MLYPLLIRLQQLVPILQLSNLLLQCVLLHELLRDALDLTLFQHQLSSQTGYLTLGSLELPIRISRGCLGRWLRVLS